MKMKKNHFLLAVFLAALVSLFFGLTEALFFLGLK
jgi:hypothetical protein